MTEVPDDQTALLRRRELATALRRHRESAGRSAKAVMHAMDFSASKLSRIETGARHVSVRDLHRLCELYGLGEEERERLTRLAEESRQPGWWERYDLPYSDYVGLEATATTIQDYKTSSIPALLQTADYARGIADGHHPHASESVIRDLVEAKMIRQQKTLARLDASHLSLAMDEAALHRAVGGEEVRRKQLGHIVDVARSERVTLNVVPFGAGWHPGMDQLFTILSFAEAVKDVVYVETPLRDLYLESRGELERYREVFADVIDTALSHDDSVRLVESLLRL